MDEDTINPAHADAESTEPPPAEGELAEVEAALRAAAARLDPVPSALFDDAMFGFAARRLDAELARLVFDSLRVETAGRIRAAGQPRTLTFEASDHAVDVEIIDTGTSCRLVGRLRSGGTAGIGVERRDGELLFRTDEFGRFATGALAPGPLRLRVAPDDGTELITPWVRL